MTRRQLNQFTIGSPVPDIELVSTRGRVRLEDYIGRKNVVLYCGRTYASSRFWLGAMILSRYSCVLEAFGAAVLMIGDRARLRQATRLATRLGLPFLILTDERDDLLNHFLTDKTDQNLVSMTILVDLEGIVRFIHHGSLPADIVDGAGLMGALRSLSTLPNAERSIPGYAAWTADGCLLS
jgi:peroxiredoxin